MTNCLRIGDVTIFRNDGSHETIEVKSNPQRGKSAHQRLIHAADDALQNAAPLPGKDRRARLFDVDVPFRMHLDLLALGTERAEQQESKSSAARRISKPAAERTLRARLDRSASDLI